MKNKAHKTIRELRRVIGQTQAEFAAMIGASKDTVASWEIGRNKLSRTFARRIACATGADGRWLLSGKGALVTGHGLEQPKPFTAEEFQRYRATEWGRSDEEGARRHLANCADALELIFLAAAKAGGEPHRHRLPGVLDSFMQWCEGAREDFQLGPAIDVELARRKFKMGVTMTYGQWRQMHRGDPTALEAVGFKDDPEKDKEELRLEIEAAPGWAPGRSMKPGRAAVKVAVLPKGVGEGGDTA